MIKGSTKGLIELLLLCLSTINCIQGYFFYSNDVFRLRFMIVLYFSKFLSSACNAEFFFPEVRRVKKYQR